MNLFGLTSDQVAARIEQSGQSGQSGQPGQELPFPSLKQSLLIGCLGFTGASLVVFATVAFAERWMYRNLGLAGAYLTWTLLFIALGASWLSPLVIGPGRLRRFLPLFGVAFLSYAAAWVGAYFSLRGPAGEVVGSLAGSLLMAVVIAAGFGAWQTFWRLFSVLLLANSAGYFLGEIFFYTIPGKAGMLLWGLVYGLGLGAGIGLSLYLVQAPLRMRLRDETAVV